MINATNEGTNFEPAPGGTFAARCYSMVHIGTIEDNIPGKGIKRVNKVRISWELPTEKKVFKEEFGEQPIVVHKEFNLSMNEKSNLRKFLEAWRGKQFTEDEAKCFDVTKLLGVACLLTIVHKKKADGTGDYADIASVVAVPKQMPVDPQINPTFEFNYSEPFDKAKFDSLPEWLRKKMIVSDEYKQATHAATPLTKEQEDALMGAEHEKQILSEQSEKGIGVVNDDLPF